MDVINLIDELDEIVYVSSLDTYELLYINEIGKKAMGLNDISHVIKHYRGKILPANFVQTLF